MEWVGAQLEKTLFNCRFAVIKIKTTKAVVATEHESNCAHGIGDRIDNVIKLDLIND